MANNSNRRNFLRGVTLAGIASLAGCSSILEDSDSEPTTPGTGTGTDDGGNRPESTSIDTFEDVSNWSVQEGKLRTTTEQEAFEGSQSIVLEPKEDSNQPIAKISRSFGSEPLDLSNRDLSLVAKVAEPDDVRIRAEVVAPAHSSMLTAVRYIPLELDDWVRFDLGYTEQNGDPVMNTVSAINLQIGPMTEEESFSVSFDDLRSYPKAKRGAVMIQFDDGHRSAYEEAFGILQEFDMPASVAVIPDAVGASDRVTEAMMTEMANAGWNMIGHASELLPEHSPEEQKRILEQTQQYLRSKGHDAGANHFVAPYSRVDASALKHIAELFTTGYLFGASPNNAAQPSNPAFLSRVQGGSIEGTKQIVDMAEAQHQLAVISYHEIGGDAVSVSDLREIIEYIDSKEVDVIKPTQFASSATL
ncbi:polysaccharide deacetylase family protein [Halocatena halophila]|uniref:polysaccharide deacetylase family protein n=1 Tax=Halocatena halophila TaxID=2814576 RepID=UPI002ED12EBB